MIKNIMQWGAQKAKSLFKTVKTHVTAAAIAVTAILGTVTVAKADPPADPIDTAFTTVTGYISSWQEIAVAFVLVIVGLAYILRLRRPGR